MLRLITELGARYDILAYKCACIFPHHGNTFTKLHRKMRFNSYNHEVSKVGMQCGKRSTANVRTIKPVPSELDIHSKKSITQKSRYAMVCSRLVKKWKSHMHFTWFRTNQRRCRHKARSDWPLFGGTVHSKFR